MAGLGAAYQIKDTKFKYLILEAQNRPGGRIDGRMMHKVESKLKSNIVNTGASWLHGRQNLLHAKAAEYDLLHSDWSEEAVGTYFRVDGSKVDDCLVKKVDFKIGEILEECEDFAEEENLTDYPESIEKFLTENFENYIATLPQNERAVARELLDYHIRFHIIDNSCLSLKHVSAKDWGTYSFNGESCQAHINFKSSFTDLISVMVEELGNVFAYNKVVDQICYGTEGEPPNAKVLVRCRDGTVYQANQVVVTFSLGVLKEKIDLFHPQLPQLHRGLIDAFGFGTINKIFIQFEDSWWDDLEGIQIVFDDRLSQTSHWTRYISGFDIVKPGAPNTLLAWVGGQGAIDMEKFCDEEVINDCLDLLRKFTLMHVPNAKAYFV